MNREIRFRAKPLNYDPQTMPEWAEGFCYQELHRGEMHHLITDGAHTFEIDPDTLGQFTGLKDAKGNEVYEGDIIHSPLHNIVIVKYGYNEECVTHGRPKITDSFASYGWIAENVKNGLVGFLDNEFLQGEVIGNIHDNPELLKTGKKE